MEKRKQPNPIDMHVGSRIRLRRNMLRLSQEKLGEKLGITFQQVQKYEKGTNRVGASRLQQLAEIMGVHVSFFFEDAPNAQMAEGNGENEGENEYLKFCSSAEGIQLMRAFSKISDPKIRLKIIDLTKALSNGQDLE